VFKYKFLILASCLLLLLGCRTNTQGSGGKAQIAGFVEFTGIVDGVYVTNARITTATTVFIKYGATSFPGVDISQYDSQQNVDSKGNFVFSTMFEGSYYLYATGIYVESNGFQHKVAGGVQVNITSRKANLNYDIAVVPVK
jgi:hypothetical protein